MATPPTAPTPEFLALQQVVKGRYSLERELGRGGMGVVFLARDVALDRPVAVKLLPPDLAARDELRAAFLREARTAARLAHPHIVPIHAVEEHDDLVFFVMAFIDGETLGARVRRAGPLAAGEVMRITQEVAWALGHAHARGVIHRDVKPDNILLERGTGRAMVTDFGIAQVVQSRDPENAMPAGTPQYMSPEQARGETVDARSDLYSLGVTAYFAATGRLPFVASNAQALLLKHAEELAPPVRDAAPRLPRAFGTAIDRLLAKRADDRFDSADALSATVGDARGAMGVVAAPVRQYLASSEQVAGELATLATAGGAVVIAMEILKLIAGDFLGITSAMELITVATTLALAGARGWQMLDETRRLIRGGYRHDAIRAAAAIVDRERELEKAAVPPHGVGARTWITAAAGAAVSTAGFVTLQVGQGFLLQVAGWMVGITAPVIAVRSVWRDFRAGKPGTLWNKLLAGRFGRRLFSLVGHTVRDGDVPLSVEPTAVLLARATEDLFHALPGYQREQLAEVPALLAKLQSDAEALRRLDDADPGKASRLEAAVAALENLRLDLLRLQAGRATVQELTADIDRARDVGRMVDAIAELATDAPDPTPAEDSRVERNDPDPSRPPEPGILGDSAD
ncbi:MAG TPA: serine/threonine-protein kinase [Gemmatimonadaceae bacterium]